MLEYHCGLAIVDCEHFGRKPGEFFCHCAASKIHFQLRIPLLFCRFEVMPVSSNCFCGWILVFRATLSKDFRNRQFSICLCNHSICVCAADVIMSLLCFVAGSNRMGNVHCHSNAAVTDVAAEHAGVVIEAEHKARQKRQLPASFLKAHERARDITATIKNIVANATDLHELGVRKNHLGLYAYGRLGVRVKTAIGNHLVALKVLFALFFSISCLCFVLAFQPGVFFVLWLQGKIHRRKAYREDKSYCAVQFVSFRTFELRVLLFVVCCAVVSCLSPLFVVCLCL